MSFFFKKKVLINFVEIGSSFIINQAQRSSKRWYLPFTKNAVPQWEVCLPKKNARNFLVLQQSYYYKEAIILIFHYCLFGILMIIKLFTTFCPFVFIRSTFTFRQNRYHHFSEYFLFLQTIVQFFFRVWYCCLKIVQKWFCTF